VYRNESLGRMERLLIESGVITPVAASLEARSWSGMELSLLVEGHFSHIVDVNALSAAERSDWEIRLDYRPDDFASQSDKYRRLHWLREGDHRVGILAIFSHLVGLNAVQIDTLYVQPEARGRQAPSRSRVSTRQNADAASKWPARSA
jgi:hypothetical protein